MTDYTNDDLKGKIPLVMLFGLTTAQKREMRMAAARAGVAPMVYLYNLVRTEPERFVVPVIITSPAPARA